MSDTKDIPIILMVFKLYEQQEYMYRNKVHSVPDRIVSISQPWIRPIVIVRGKVKVPVEFGAKPDASIDSERYGRLEKVSFDAYNESGCLNFFPFMKITALEMEIFLLKSANTALTAGLAHCCTIRLTMSGFMYVYWMNIHPCLAVTKHILLRNPWLVSPTQSVISVAYLKKAAC